MKKIGIIGNGQHAKGVKVLIDCLKDYKFSGYIGKKKNKSSKFTDDDIDILKKNNINHLALGIGNLSYSWIEKLIIKYEKNGFKFPSLIHPSSVISPLAKIGNGVIVMENAVIKHSSLIKKMSVINSLSLVSHDCTVGEYSYISPGVIIGAETDIGKNNFFGMNSKIINGGIKIGSNVYVGGGSMVINNLPSKVKVFGNPAKIIGKNTSKKNYK